MIFKSNSPSDSVNITLSPCVPSPGVLLTKSFLILFHIIDKPTLLVKSPVAKATNTKEKREMEKPGRRPRL